MMLSADRCFVAALLVLASACIDEVSYVGKQCDPGGTCPGDLQCSAENICERSSAADDPSDEGASDQGGSGSTTDSELPSGGSDGNESGDGIEPSVQVGAGGSLPPAQGGGGGPPQGQGGASASPPVITVTGHVIDFLRRPVPGTPVTIGAATTETDALGEFTVDGVEPPYDVELLVESIGDYSHAWVYQGLTRHDPTLQVYVAGTPQSCGEFSVNANLVLGDTQEFSFGAASPDGVYSRPESSPSFSDPWEVEWYGPTETTFAFHGLLWENSEAGLPLTYVSHDAKLIAVQRDQSVDVSFDLASEPIGLASVTGSVSGWPNEYRNNAAYLHFDDGAQIELFAQYFDAPAAFQYAVPVLSETSIVVAASAGRNLTAPYAIVHRQVDASDQNVDLVIPTPASLRAPLGGAEGVEPGTAFEWDGDAGAYLLFIEDEGLRRGIRLLTTQKSVNLAALSNLELRPGAEHYWRVETHGSGRNVDELTGPEGFADAFSSVGGSGGPRSAEGSFTSSGNLVFVTRADTPD